MTLPIVQLPQTSAVHAYTHLGQSRQSIPGGWLMGTAPDSEQEAAERLVTARLAGQ
jgi:hypothetical protein